jgi:hypothetical protein
MKIAFLLLSLFFTRHSYALLEFEDAAFPELITSARALALGNAYGAKVDDGWAAFYNPAGLGTVRGLQMHLANVHAELNSGFLKITEGEGSFFENIDNYSAALTATGMRTLLANNPGNTSHARVQLFPNITYRGITLGYMYSKQNRARLQSSSSDLELAERTDMGPLMSLSVSLFGGVLKFGATGIYLTREEFQKDIASGDPININKQTDYRRGSMVHVTAGMRLTLPVFLLPTLSVVSRNSSDVEFDSPDFAGLPNKIPQTTDASFSITPFNGRTSRTHIEIGMKDIGNRYEDVPSGRKLVGGIEIDWYRKMFFRLGYGDGWGSGGIGVRNKSFIFDLTTYAVELDPEGYRQDEDRRYVMSISSGF